MRRLTIAALMLAATVHAAGPPTVVFLSDFGTRDDAVAICKGVMIQVEPMLRVIDLTHQVTPFAIADAARLLADTADRYPAGTVFLGVIDPGVGTERKAMIARSKRGQFFVLPDNGLLTLVEDRQGLVGAREIVNPRWMLAAARSSTFHGRDVFSPAAAHLAHGADWTQAGPPIAKPVRLDIRAARLDGDVIRGTVIATDGNYGNLLTDVDATLFQKLGWRRGDTVPVEIGGTKLDVPFVRTFGDVPEGKPLLYVDSRSSIGVALNLGNFAETEHVAVPSPIVIHKK